MKNMADQEQGPEAASNFSSMLFTDKQYQPLIFSIRPSATRARLKLLIENGGGIVTSRHDPSESNVIKILAHGDKHSSHDCLVPSYIDDCVAANSLLDKSAYRVNSLSEDQSTRASEVTVNVSTKGRSYYTAAEDNAILEYIAKHPYQYGGNKIWKRMELMKITNHSWQSMRDHFLKKLEGRLKKYTKERTEKLLMKQQKDSDSEVDINEPRDEDVERETSLGENITQAEGIIAEDEPSDTSSFDLDLFQAASTDLKNQEADGRKDEGTEDEVIPSPRSKTAPSSSDENQSRQEQNPAVQALVVRRSTRQTNKEKYDVSTKSPIKVSYKTRSKSDGNHVTDEFESGEKVAVDDKQGKKSKGEKQGDSCQKEGEHMHVARKTRGKKILENQDEKAGEKSAAKELSSLKMDDISVQNGGTANDAMQTDGIDDSALNLDGIDDSTMQPDRIGTEDKSTHGNKKSRSKTDDSSPEKIVVVRLSSTKKRKTPVKSPLGTATIESQKEPRKLHISHSSPKRTPPRRSRRGMEIVSDSSASDDSTSDVLPMKRTRHTSTPNKHSSTVLDHADHPSDSQAEEDSEHYSNVIEELCTKYRQTKSKICTALYVHSGDFTRTEVYLQCGSQTKGPMWSSSQDKLLLSSPCRQDISMRYGKAAVNQRRKWLQS